LSIIQERMGQKDRPFITTKEVGKNEAPNSSVRLGSEKGKKLSEGKEKGEKRTLSKNFKGGENCGNACHRKVRRVSLPETAWAT